MPHLSGYEVGRIYMAVKLHFTTESYDYFKYRGQIKTFTQESFDVRRDRYQFHKLSKKYKEEEIEPFMVANIMRKPKSWVGEFVTDEAHDCYKEFLGRLEKLSYIFEQDILKLKDACTEAGTTLDASVRGDHPFLLKMYYRKLIIPETMVILDFVFNSSLFSMWDTNIKDTVLWPKTRMLLKKFQPFIPVDVQKYVDIVKKIVKDT